MQFGSIAALAAAVLSSGGEATVCVRNDAAPRQEWLSAEQLAGEMFRAIGVHIVWSCASREGAAVLVRVVDRRVNHAPDDLAFVAPFAVLPAPVVILFNHVKSAAGGSMRLRATLLAHVLVHEIAHVLAGDDAHSPEGVMKRRWSAEDMQEMLRAPLGFTSYDAARVHLGLDRLARARRQR